MTTVLSPIDLAHLVQVVCTDRLRAPGRVLRAAGPARGSSSRSDAQDAAGTDHREIAVGPPDGLDPLLSGLLDLQDDLADAVMWLAENWSADLPVPDAYSRNHDRDDGDRVAGVVRLLVLLRHRRAELARVGRPARRPGGDRPGAGPCTGQRYERAVRHFGRVSIDAYRCLEPRTAP